MLLESELTVPQMIAIAAVFIVVDKSILYGKTGLSYF